MKLSSSEKYIWIFLTESAKHKKKSKRWKKFKKVSASNSKWWFSSSNSFKYSLFLGFKPFVLADFRANFKDDLLSFSDELQDITKSLQDFYSYKKEDKILISPIRTISFPMPKKECFAELKISFADNLDLSEFKTNFIAGDTIL